MRCEGKDNKWSLSEGLRVGIRCGLGAVSVRRTHLSECKNRKRGMGGGWGQGRRRRRRGYMNPDIVGEEISMKFTVINKSVRLVTNLLKGIYA